VLEGRLAGVGGAKSTGAVIAPAAPLVDRLKYLRSICGEIFGSEEEGVASGSAAVLVAGELVAAGAGAGGTNGAGGVEKSLRVDEGGSGGGRGITIKLVPGWGAGRKRKGTGPTTGK
jgi:hypothetical protein